MSESTKTPDRIPCINAACRRTAAADKFFGQEIVCAKCWKTLPSALKRRHAQTKARCRALRTKLQRRHAEGKIATERADRIWEATNLQRIAAWERVRAYLNNPPAPSGLENFLKEIGIEPD